MRLSIGLDDDAAKLLRGIARSLRRCCAQQAEILARLAPSEAPSCAAVRAEREPASPATRELTPVDAPAAVAPAARERKLERYRALLTELWPTDMPVAEIARRINEISDTTVSVDSVCSYASKFGLRRPAKPPPNPSARTTRYRVLLTELWPTDTPIVEVVRRMSEIAGRDLTAHTVYNIAYQFGLGRRRKAAAARAASVVDVEAAEAPPSTSEAPPSTIDVAPEMPESPPPPAAPTPTPEVSEPRPISITPPVAAHETRPRPVTAAPQTIGVPEFSSPRTAPVPMRAPAALYERATGEVVAEWDSIAAWAAPRGIAFNGGDDLDAVNARRSALGLPRFRFVLHSERAERAA